MNRIKEICIHIAKNDTYIVVFLLLFLLAALVNNNFASYASFSNLVKQSAVIGILALGMGMVIICGEIDLSVGAAVCAISAASIEVLNKTANIPVVILFAVGMGMALSFVNGFLIARLKVPAFIATLSTMLILRAAAQYFAQNKTGGQYIVDTQIYNSFRVLASGSILGVPYLALYLLGLTAVIYYIMTQTKFGRTVYAVGSNAKAAQLAGIPIVKTKVAVFILSGVCMGIGSILLVSRLSAIQPASAGSGYELDAIAAVVIGNVSMDGGRGKIQGILFGVLIFQIISTVTTFAGLPPLLVGIVKGVVILAAVLAQGKKEQL